MSEADNVYDRMLARQRPRESERVARARAIMRGEEPPKRPNRTGGQLREPVYSPEADRIMAKHAKKK